MRKLIIPRKDVRDSSRRLSYNSTSDVSAITLGILGIAALEEEARFLVALFVQVMQQGWVRRGGQRPCQLINSGEERQQAGLGIGRGHEFDRLFQFQQ